MTGSALVDWTSFGKALVASIVAVLSVTVLFSLVARGLGRGSRALAAAGLAGCLVAIAVGVIAMTHK